MKLQKSQDAVDVGAPKGTSKRIASPDVIGSLILVVSLAMSQPVLDLLSRNLPFFTAHEASALDVVGLALLLAVAVPFLVALPLAALVRLAPRTGVGLYALSLGVLTASVVLQFLERMMSSTGLAVLLASVIGALLAFACLRIEALQTSLRWGTLVPGAVLGLFLVFSPGSQLVFAADAAPPDSAVIGNPAPVVILVLDELPVQSLMDAKGDIDATRYPGFARLLEDFTWFRNTVTMHHNTSHVLPMLLSGGSYRPDTELSSNGYPNNLFTLLGESYNVWAHEEVTAMCDPEVCRDQPRPSTTERWQLLLNDTTIVAAHMLLPEEATAGLPPVDAAWAGFGDLAPEQDAGSLEDSDDAREPDFDDFLESLESMDAHSLRYFHYMAPHHPWRSLPGGLLYPGDVGIPHRTAEWGDDQHVVDRAHQRHLLQTGYVDGQIGQFLDVLRETPAYEDSLILVMADHGIAFTAGGYFRGGTNENIEEVGFVPLFVKTPGQVRGRIDERPASLHDVLPTVVDAFEIESAWSMAGVSLLEDQPDLDRRRVFEGLDRIELPPRHEPVDDALARKVALFGAGQGWDPVYNFERYGDLVGETITSLALEEEPAEVELIDPGRYGNVDPATGAVPALVRASIRSATVTADTWLAVAVNGTVATTGRVHSWTPDGADFSAIVPPESFVMGDNEVTLYRIEETARGPFLHLLTRG